MSSIMRQKGQQVDVSVCGPGQSRRWTSQTLAEFVARSVDAARASDDPFFRLELDRIFPEDVYAQILELKPSAADYRPMHGRSKGLNLADGTHTLVKIDLFPEYIRHLPRPKREFWRLIGGALTSDTVCQAFIQRLAPGLVRRFGPGFAAVGMYPVPVLTRDIPGYWIPPHTDTHWKGITVQLYLPDDDANTDVGTIFLERNPDGSFAKKAQMPFAPNTGYAFAVTDDSWHSADKVHARVTTRDSVLLTYFVDRGLVRRAQSRQALRQLRTQ